MKTMNLRATAIAFAAALAGAVGCGSGGCGGQNMNTNSAPSAPSMQCGQGTYLNSSNQCVPRPNNSTTSSTHPTHL